MIYQMCLDLTDMLRARDYPFRVYYGPEYAGQDNFRSRALIEYDRQTGDTVSIGRGTGRGGGLRAEKPMYFVRAQGCRARVYAQSTLGGAMLHNHEELCALYVDALQIALEDWLTEAKAAEHLQVRPGGRFLSESELIADRQEWPGAVYEFQFVVPRGVAKVDGEGAGPLTGTIEDVETTVTAKLPGE